MSPRGSIGRPGLGGEFLLVELGAFNDWRLKRYKRINSVRDEPRQLKVASLPATAMIYDLLECIELIVEHDDPSLDDRGFAGEGPTLRERFAALASRRRGS